VNFDKSDESKKEGKLDVEIKSLRGPHFPESKKQILLELLDEKRTVLKRQINNNMREKPKLKDVNIESIIRPNTKLLHIGILYH